ESRPERGSATQRTGACDRPHSALVEVQMASSHTAERHIELSALDQQRANRSLQRASWLIIGLFAAMALTFWLAPEARINGHLRLLRVARLAFVVELITLIGLVVVLRRKLGAQTRRVAAHLDLLVKQNARLAESNTELEEQAELQQAQALELETQTAELQARAAALEATNASLQASERRQQQLADELRLLSGRLSEAQHVANLGYWEIDSDTGQVFWSEEMYRLAGIEPDTGMRPTDFSLRCTLRTASACTPSPRTPLPSFASSPSSIASCCRASRRASYNPRGGSSSMRSGAGSWSARYRTSPSGCSSRRSCGKRRRWTRSASSPAAWRMTSTTCSR